MTGLAFTPSEVSSYYASRVRRLRQTRAAQWRGPCPIHKGDGDNFSVDAKTGRWFCHSQCGCGGDIIDFERALTGAKFLEAVAAIESIVGRPLLERPTNRAEIRRAAEAAVRDRRELQAAEHFKIAAAMMFEEILEKLPEAAPERYAPTQALLEIRTAQGPELLALYRDWRKHEPNRTAALVYAGERAWNRLCTQLARFIDAGAEVPRAA
jgi:DNA primase